MLAIPARYHSKWGNQMPLHGAQGFASQKPVEFELHGYQLTIPSNHLLVHVLNPQSSAFEPYRESGLIKLAKSLGRRSGIAIDIGANVGDTCAILHRHTELRVFCVDASDFFFPYLTKNIRSHFSTRAIAEHAYVTANRGEGAKSLYHFLGTAKPIEDQPPTETCGTIFIGDLIDKTDNVALLKTDIDGQDIDLIDAALRHIAPRGLRFPIYFEFELQWTSPEEAKQRAHKLLALSHTAISAGYTSAFLWDEPGRFYGLINLERRDSVVNAINYLGHSQHQVVWGYDICLIHKSDVTLAADLIALISPESVLPVDVDWSPNL